MSRGWVVVRDRNEEEIEFLGEQGWVSELLPECVIETEAQAKRYVRQPGEVAVTVERAEAWLKPVERRGP